MRVSVFGIGYVGCVTAACLARDGHDVTAVDVDDEKVALVNDGRSPVVEPGMDALVADGVRAGRLRATGRVDDGVTASELALLCVGTPGRDSGALDAAAVERVGTAIGAALRGQPAPFTIVLRSTVLPGTTESVLVPALTAGAGGVLPRGLRIAVNPEFMREGSSLADFASPPFTLIGTADPVTAARVKSLYAAVAAPLVVTTVANAEMVKYVANAFHALKVCFANEVGDVCEALGADGAEVMRIFALDRKLSVSPTYLRPGFAFGGSCLPKDLRALLHAVGTSDVSAPVLSAILPSNEAQVRRGVAAVLGARRRRIGVVGLAFKPGTDDLRESPLVTLVETLIDKGCQVRVLDRHVALARLLGENRRRVSAAIPDLATLLVDEVDQLLAHAEVLVIGHAGSDAEAAVAAAGPDVTVVDLTRRVARRPSRARKAAS